MNKELIHYIGVLFIFFAFSLMLHSFLNLDNLERDGLVVVIAVVVSLFFLAIVFFAWNISANIRDFLRAYTLAQKDEGERKECSGQCAHREEE